MTHLGRSVTFLMWLATLLAGVLIGSQCAMRQAADQVQGLL